MGRSIYLTEKEILALIDTSGEWIQMMMSGDISTQQEVDNRLNEGLGRALKKLYKGHNGERIYKDYKGGEDIAQCLLKAFGEN